jgi:hypothetical protein
VTTTRITIGGFTLLIAAASPARAQQRTPRSGGDGTAAASTSSPQATHSHVSSRGPFLTVPSAAPGSGSAGQASGGSWDGRRPDYGGSPPVQRVQQGNDLSSFFGYVPPRGQTAQNVPVQQAARLVPLVAAQSGLGSAVATASPSSMQPSSQPSSQPATQPDLPSSTQPVAQSADQPVVRRGGHSLVEAPKTDAQRRPARITWP